MNTTNDIKKKDDALRLVMQRRKERRPVAELPEGFEDRVMARIYTTETASAPKAKVVRLWVLRAVSAAAVVVGVICLIGVLKPDGNKSLDVAAKVEEVYRPIVSEPEKELPQMAEVRTPTTPRKRQSPKPRKQETADDVMTKVAEDVCISCEIDAMSDELTAMINEFENQ